MNWSLSVPRTLPVKEPSTPSSSSLRKNKVLVVERVGHLFGRRHEPRRLVHADAILGVERAAAEDDRRDMPLAGGAQAQHEPACSLFQSGLVGMPDHGRIEERGRFQGVFLGEVRADQHPAILGERLVGEQVFLEQIKPVQKEVAGFLMAAVKLAHHVVEQGVDFRFRERHDPGDDPFDPMVAGRLERPDHDPAVVGLQDDARPAYLQPEPAHGRGSRLRLSWSGSKEIRLSSSIRSHPWRLAPDLGVKRSIGPEPERDPLN